MNAYLDNMNNNFRVHNGAAEKFKVDLISGTLYSINASDAFTTMKHSGAAGGNTHIDTYGGAGGIYLNWYSG